MSNGLLQETKSKLKVGGIKIRGFVIPQDEEDLIKAFSELYIKDPKDPKVDKHYQEFLRRPIGCASSEHIRFRRLDDFYLCYNSSSEIRFPNKLATKLAYSYGDRTVMRGNIAVVLLKDELKVSCLSLDVVDELQKRLVQVMERADEFENWYKEASGRFGSADEAGHFIYIPLRGDGGHGNGSGKLLPVTCKGWLNLAEECRKHFNERGATKKDFSEESEDEEEGLDAQMDAYPDNISNVVDAQMRETFAGAGMNLVYTIGGLNLVSVDRSKQTQAQRQGGLNETAARYVYHKVGLEAMLRLLSHLRGDVIIFRPHHWHLESECGVVSFDEGEHVPFLAASYLGLAEAEEELQAVLAQQDLGSCLMRFASFTRYADQLQDLQKLAQREDWSLRLPSTFQLKGKGGKGVGKNRGAQRQSVAEMPYLDNYIRFMFALSVKHKEGVHFGTSKAGKRSLVFATGLLDMYQQPIYGHFQRDMLDQENVWEEPLDASKKWFFKKWDTRPGISGGLASLDILSDKLLRQGCASVNMQLHEIKTFNPFAEIKESNLEHILEKADRFAKDNEFHRTGDGSGWKTNPEEKASLAQQFKDGLRRAKLWARYDRSAAVITCFHQGSYQWLLPLLNPTNGPQQTPTLAVVLRPMRRQEEDPDFVYVVKTVLDLDMALKQARLCGMLSQRWTVGCQHMATFEEVQRLINEIPCGGNPEISKAVKTLIKAYKNQKIKLMAGMPCFGPVEEIVDYDVNQSRGTAWRRDVSGGSQGSRFTVLSEPAVSERGQGDGSDRDWSSLRPPATGALSLSRTPTFSGPARQSPQHDGIEEDGPFQQVAGRHSGGSGKSVGSKKY